MSTTTIIKPYPNIISKCNNILKIHKSYLFNKKIHILSSSIIKQPINKLNYVNVDIKTTPIPILQSTKDYIIGFTNVHLLDFLKKHVDHPYNISQVKISDILYYLEKSDSNLLIVNDINCDNVNKTSTYSTFNIILDDLSKQSCNNYIPVNINKIIFDNYNNERD